MQVSVETTQGLERRLTITVPAETFDTEYKKRIRQVAKTQRIDGFRPGKVPASVIQQRFGAAVAQEVAGELMQRNFFEAVIAEKLNPAGQPTLEPTQVQAGKDFIFNATFEVYPEVDVTGLEAIEVERPVASVTEESLDAMIDTLRKQHAAWVDVDREAANGDQVNIDFTGSIDGEEFEGGKAEGFNLAMGEGRMIPGFEDGVMGKKAGDEFTIDVTFPEEYHAENLKGKEATFSITLNKVQEQELPELDDEFVQKFGVAEGSVEALRAEVSKNMARELEQAIKNRVKEQVLNGLVEQNEIDVPSTLIDNEVNALRQQAMQRFGGQVDPNNAPELPAELFHEQAQRRVKVGLLLGEFIRGEEIKADEAAVDALIESMASAYEDPSEVVTHYKQDEKMMESMRNVAIEEAAVEAILAKAIVSEKEMSFEDLMNPAQ